MIRHGLDMAFSNNQNQVINWGKLLFNIPVPNINDPSLPRYSLKYWNKANNKALERGKKYLGHNNFMLLHFEDLCREPEKNIKKLLRFLEISPDTVDVKELASLPQLPSSVGRYKNHDLSIFDKKDIKQVEQLGYKIN